MFAVIRPDDWNFPLLLHVLGAALLVGGLTTAVAGSFAGWNHDRTGAYARVGFRALLFVAIPSWILMRIGAEWIYSREGFEGEDEPGWLGIGYVVADGGALLILLATILAGVGLRRTRKSGSEAGASGLSRAAGVIALVALIAYVIAAWAMSAKPD